MPKYNATMLMSAVAVLAVAGAAYAVHAERTANARAPFGTVAVTRADLSRDVRLTGSVVPASDVDLAFERGGTVVASPFKVGDAVHKGEVLVSLSAADLSAQLAQAQAGLAGAEARLRALEQGARPEDLDLSDTEVRAAEDAVDEARRALVHAVTDAFDGADDAIRAKTDRMFTDPNGTAPALAFFVADSAAASDLGWRRLQLGVMLDGWAESVRGLGVQDDAAAASAEAKSHLSEIQGFLSELAEATGKISLAANPGMTRAALDADVANVSLARTTVDASVSALNAGDERLRGALSALELARGKRTLKAAGATAQDLAAQDAVVAQARAAVRAVQAQLGKTVLRAPIDGVVSAIGLERGEAAVPGATAVSVISDDLFEVDALASETQVARVHVGDAASVTLDAYGTGETFAAEVLAVDPAPVGDGAASGYRVTLRFLEDDARVKAGMTANALITSDVEHGALVLPRQAVLLRGDGAEVLAETDGAFVQKPVTVGIVTDDRVQITEGLEEGDRVADFGGTR